MENVYAKKDGKVKNVLNEYVGMVFMEKNVIKYVDALLKTPNCKYNFLTQIIPLKF